MRHVKPHIPVYKATRNLETGEAVLPPRQVILYLSALPWGQRQDAGAEGQLVLPGMAIPTFQCLYVKSNSSVITKTNLSEISW